MTSKAVVGSSAINTAGLQEIAIAIIAATDRLKVGGDSGQAFLVSAGSPTAESCVYSAEMSRHTAVPTPYHWV